VIERGQSNWHAYLSRQSWIERAAFVHGFVPLLNLEARIGSRAPVSSTDTMTLTAVSF
jgi:hypothetical protein